MFNPHCDCVLRFSYHSHLKQSVSWKEMRLFLVKPGALLKWTDYLYLYYNDIAVLTAWILTATQPSPNNSAKSNLMFQAVCHVCVMAGVCFRMLKPVKTVLTRRNKKKKDNPIAMVRVLLFCGWIKCLWQAVMWNEFLSNWVVSLYCPHFNVA